MEKKIYQQPAIEKHFIQPTVMLDGSTGASGDDIPWGAKELNVSDIEFDSKAEDYLNY